MKISSEPFGTTENGENVERITLTNENGMSVSVITYGATLQSVLVRGRDGNLRDVCLGYKTVREYEEHDGYLGATVGRYANRIGKARFPLNGETVKLLANEGENQLHGGNGFSHRLFSWEKTGDDRVTFSYFSPDGESGFPGNMRASVTFSLSEQNELTLSYQAECDKDTVANFTNHAYWNLNGEGSGDILSHWLRIFADRFTPIDGESIPTGELRPVEGSAFDFRTTHTIGERINWEEEQLRMGKGYDHNFCLSDPGKLKKAAEVKAEESGITMTVYTTMPGIQLYSGNFLSGVQGKSGAYFMRSGLCLETQFYPDSPNHPEFPSPILRKGECYRHKTVYCF